VGRASPARLRKAPMNQQTDRRESGSSRAWATAGLGLALVSFVAMGVACFRGVLFEDRQFGLRDAAHFYYPLYQRVQQEWEAGRWPLWSPEENAGMPLLGNPTAAVFYPGKLVFFALAYPWAMRSYVIAHVVLAFVSMRAMLRGWRVSPTGSTIGAIAFAFGAPVLSQSCNVIFLVGAAWAPFGFLAADRWLRLRRRGALTGLAVVLAMQVLGGDPQAAYLTVLCASAYAAGLAAARVPSGVARLSRRLVMALVVAYPALMAISWWTARARHAAAVAPTDSTPTGMPSAGTLLVSALWTVVATVFLRNSWKARGAWGIGPMIGGLTVASGLAAAVAGVQVVPTVEFLRLSLRNVGGDGAHNVYPFSFHPLRVIGTVWPGIFGTTDLSNRSWVESLPPTHDPRIWAPSTYLGGLTLVLAASAAGFKGGPAWRAWLSGVAAVSLFASFGSFGSPLFWARCVPGWASSLGSLESPVIGRLRDDGLLSDGDGGLYWLFASTLPLFRSFRYPEKLSTFTTLALAGLAGLGWDQLIAGRSRRAVVIAGGLLAMTLAFLTATWLDDTALQFFLRGRAGLVPSTYGPLDVAGAVADLRAALGQGALALGFALVCAPAAARRPELSGLVALAALTLDLASANARHVVTVPQSAFEGTPRLLKAIEGAERRDPSPGPFRVYRLPPWVPTGWERRGSPRRVEDLVRWERNTLSPKYGIPLGVHYTLSIGTAEVFDYRSLFPVSDLRLDAPTARRFGLEPHQKVVYHPRRAFDLWATRYFILPARGAWDSPWRGLAAFSSRVEVVDPDARAIEASRGEARGTSRVDADDVQVVRNLAVFPRAWVVHKARVIPLSWASRPAVRRKLIQEILYQNDDFWHEPGKTVFDPRRLAWVETDRPQDLAPFLSQADPDPAETVTVTRDDPQRVEMTAVLNSPGLVIVGDVFYPGWTLTVDGRPAEILRANRAMRGVALPTGSHRLDFRYEPRSFRFGVLLSLIGLIGLGRECRFLLRERVHDRMPHRASDDS
jgi:hypothetical protein